MVPSCWNDGWDPGEGVPVRDGVTMSGSVERFTESSRIVLKPEAYSYMLSAWLREGTLTRA